MKGSANVFISPLNKPRSEMVNPVHIPLFFPRLQNPLNCIKSYCKIVQKVMDIANIHGSGTISCVNKIHSPVILKYMCKSGCSSRKHNVKWTGNLKEKMKS